MALCLADSFIKRAVVHMAILSEDRKQLPVCTYGCQFSTYVQDTSKRCVKLYLKWLGFL